MLKHRHQHMHMVSAAYQVSPRQITADGRAAAHTLQFQCRHKAMLSEPRPHNLCSAALQ